jgi:hypothetical protein
VAAVDESPEMLERIHGAETMLGRIEDLDLGRRLDAVLFASYLVNVPNLDWRRTLLAACRRHVIDAYSPTTGPGSGPARSPATTGAGEGAPHPLGSTVIRASSSGGPSLRDPPDSRPA